MRTARGSTARHDACVVAQSRWRRTFLQGRRHHHLSTAGAEAARGGDRDAGRIISNDLLEDLGVLVGVLSADSCQQAINLLQGRDLQGMEHPNDPAYSLAALLLAAQINLAVGSEFCPAADRTVKAGQLLLISLGFDGSASYLGPPQANQDVQTAQTLAEQLASYNTGILCQ